VLIGLAATEKTFKEQAQLAGIIHLATHASYNPLRPMLSSIQLEPGGGEDGQLEVREILELRLNADLVTLSACSTGMSSGYFADMPAADDLVGFTRAFLYAGSRSVLASLWDVDDLSTSLLMGGFYARIGRMDKAQALSEAQRELRNHNAKYQHPYYWAPFTFVGKMN
jgi:CHAT domain-containing protein